MNPKQIPTRFLVLESTKEDKELILRIEKTFYINESEEFKCILRGLWSNLIIEPGDFINVFEPKIENSNILIVDNSNGLIIVKPDILLPITTLMSATICQRKAWLSSIFKIFGEQNKALLVGRIIHELFQECLRRKIYVISQIENILLKDIINKFTLDLYSLNMNLEDLIFEIKPYLKPISYWIQTYSNQNSCDNVTFVIKRLHDIENTIWSTKYGFIGKIDLSLEVIFYDKVHKNEIFDLVPVELKTGRHTFSNQHVGQIMIYSLIIKDKYVNYKPSGGFLIYLKDEAKTHYFNTDHNIFRDLIIQRNLFIRYYDKIGFIDESNRKKLFKGPAEIDRKNFCKYCEHNLDCSLINKCFDSNPLENNESNFSTMITSHLKSYEMEFFANMISLLEIEKQYQLASDDFVSFWNFRSEECEKSGIGVSKMKIKHQDERTIVFFRNPKVSLSAKLLTLNSELNMNLSLLEDRRVVISEEMINSTKTFEIYGNFCKQLCIIIGQISSFSEDQTEIAIHLEKPLINALNPNATYRIDFLKNLSTRAMLTNFSNLLRLMSDEPRAAELREIIIYGNIPKLNLNDCKFSSFSQLLNSPILEKLNIQQKRCIMGIIKTKCSLIFGSPGSGKTQTIVALIQILVELGYSVLVTAFTHVAVDNILMKLVKANYENGKNVQFLRIGPINRINSQLLDHSDYCRTNMWLENGDVQSLNYFYSNIPVVASTCLGVFNHPLFDKRKFDFCIIDEASQVYLSTSLGPLFNCQNFVLVGDQKQLPPVVQSPYARKLGLDESLFARLLNMSGKHDVTLYDENYNLEDMENYNSKNNNINIDLKSIRIFPLFIQYRMNSVIMNIANKLTYSGQLKCFNKEVESISMLDFLLDHNRNNIFEEYQHSYLSKVISPFLQDSVVFIDTSFIKEAFELRCTNEGFSQNLDLSKTENSSQVSFVYNEFEAQLINHIVQILLLAYGNKRSLKVDNIGIISPFRRQVTRIKELFGSEFFEQNNLEINTVDQYQGRDKDIIIYSCVKSCEILEDKSQNSIPIIDSELLKDERRLNVAITRAKRKLIIIGNQKSLIRYLPFRNLFNVLDSHQFINLIDYNYQEIIDLI